MNARLSPAAWADAALVHLARGGLTAVAVEPIARDLGVTKGSFYWHFKSRGALVAAALARWEEQVAVLTRPVDDAEEARARLRRLFEAALELPEAGYLVVHLTAAAHDPAIGPTLARVTRRRVTYIASLYEACGWTPDAARHRAALAYAAYVGLYQTLIAVPAWRDEDRTAWVHHAMDTLLPQ